MGVKCKTQAAGSGDGRSLPSFYPPPFLDSSCLPAAAHPLAAPSCHPLGFRLCAGSIRDSRLYLDASALLFLHHCVAMVMVGESREDSLKER